MTHESGTTLWSTVRTSKTGRAGRAPVEVLATHEECADPAMNREQVIDQILSINTSATNEFLSQFDCTRLNIYLRHLIASQEPRGREARWSRPADAPAIMASRRLS